VPQVAVCSQAITKHIHTVWAELTVVKMFNLLVTRRLYKVNKRTHGIHYGRHPLKPLVTSIIFDHVRRHCTLRLFLPARRKDYYGTSGFHYCTLLILIPSLCRCLLSFHSHLSHSRELCSLKPRESVL
jgi:hypothetical protein